MKGKKKLVSLLLVMTLCLGMAVQAEAAGIDEAKKKAEELENQKKEAEAEKESLTTQLADIISDMEETKTQIETMEEEITAKEEELIEAKIDESNQYDSMKKRIRYMYENGNTQFIEILCASQSIGDFLNNAEYITTISEYDRDMLTEFQEVVTTVEEQEKALQEEYDELEVMQNDLIAKQTEVENTINSKDEEISELDTQLGDAKATLAELEEAAATAARKQNEANNGYSPNAGGSLIVGNGRFAHPCPDYTYVSSEFGWRPQPIPGASSNHKGMDFAAGTGTPIYAADSGRVIQASYSGKAGNLVIIDHGGGLQTYYMHTNQMFVRAGQTVSKGDNIATVGNTGNSSGPHLHFQVMQNGTPVNPRNFL